MNNNVVSKKNSNNGLIIAIIVLSILIGIVFLTIIIFNVMKLKDKKEVKEYLDYSYQLNYSEGRIVFYGINSDNTLDLVNVYQCKDYCDVFQYSSTDEYVSKEDNVILIWDDKVAFLYNYVTGKKLTKEYKEVIGLIDREEYNKHENPIYFSALDPKTQKYGVIDTLGKEIVKFDYDSLGNGYSEYSIENDCIIAEKNKKFGVIELSTGKVLLNHKYGSPKNMELQIIDREHYIVNENGAWKLIDNNEKNLIGKEYQFLKYIKDDNYAAISNNELSIIDSNGNMQSLSTIPVDNPDNVNVTPLVTGTCEIRLNTEGGHDFVTYDKTIATYYYDFGTKTFAKK